MGCCRDIYLAYLNVDPNLHSWALMAHSMIVYWVRPHPWTIMWATYIHMATRLKVLCIELHCSSLSMDSPSGLLYTGRLLLIADFEPNPWNDQDQFCLPRGGDREKMPYSCLMHLSQRKNFDGGQKLQKRSSKTSSWPLSLSWSSRRSNPTRPLKTILKLFENWH